MSVIIENEYEKNLDLDYEKIIQDVVEEAVNFVQCPYECEVSVSIVDNEAIHELNRETREIDRPTDVLSFPMLEYTEPANFSDVEEDVSNFNPDTGELILGDIVISYDKVIAQAEEYGHSLRREFAFLVAHSMLHLFGYDHMEEAERVEMEEKQEIILKNLGITRNQ
ncbi:MAG: rRNA maturation RNase YbeY [Eubacterium sp.]|nr:rRNA maturation RNase YbeY [Eubacterium sp.]